MSDNLADRDRLIEDIVEILPGGIFQFHIHDDGTMWFDYRSRHAYELAHMPPDWSLGINAHPEDRDRLIESVHEAARTLSRWSFEGRGITRSGDIRWVEGVALLRREEDRIVFNGLLLDITERKEAEEAILDRQARLDSIFKTVPAGVGMSVNRVFTEVNERFCEMTGYSREELIGQSARMLYSTQEEYDEVGTNLYEQIGKMGTGTVETQMQRKDRTAFDVLLSSTATAPEDWSKGLTFTLLDITEHKRTEEALRLTQFSVDHASDAAFWIDSDARFVYVNRAACRSLGYSFEELLDMTVFDIDPVFTREQWVESWQELEQQGSRSLETLHRTKQGEVFPVEIATRILEFGGKKYDFAFARDISERKRVEQEKQHFYRETIKSVTQGKLDLVSPDEVDVYLDSAELTANIASPADAANARRDIAEFCASKGLGHDRLALFETAVGEAITNALKHANEGLVYAGSNDGAIWVAVSDTGPGIPALTLPSATLRAGFSTKASLGMGYSIMMEASDGILLCTGPQGTTVVLSVQTTAPEQVLSLDELPDTWD